jgi:hypothetical protein
LRKILLAARRTVFAVPFLHGLAHVARLDALQGAIVNFNRESDKAANA